MSSTNFKTYEEFKTEILSKKIGRKSVSLSEIRLIAESAIEVNGVSLALSPSGFTSLLRIVGISKQMRLNLIKQYGDSFADALVSSLSKAMGTTKGNVILLIDMRKKRVLNIVKSSESMLDNEAYLRQVENVIGDSNLSIDNMVVRETGGFTLSTVGDNSEWGLKGIESTESFKFGLNFDNDPIKGTRLMPYNQRLVCTNGMIGQGFVGVHQFTNDTDSWNEFYHKIDVLKKDNFKPTEFSSTLKSIMSSNASVSEVTQARNIIKANSKVSDGDLELYVPIASTEEAYKKHGVLIDTFNKDQKENARTDVSYWELINGLTDFASHNYGHELTNPDTLQRHAGRLFVKQPDLSNLVGNPFG
jgi:hypothetical protein